MLKQMGSISSLPSVSSYQSLYAGRLGCHSDSCFQLLVFIFCLLLTLQSLEGQELRPFMKLNCSLIDGLESSTLRQKQKNIGLSAESMIS